MLRERGDGLEGLVFGVHSRGGMERRQERDKVGKAEKSGCKGSWNACLELTFLLIATGATGLVHFPSTQIWKLFLLVSQRHLLALSIRWTLSKTGGPFIFFLLTSQPNLLPLCCSTIPTPPGFPGPTVPFWSPFLSFAIWEVSPKPLLTYSRTLPF